MTFDPDWVVRPGEVLQDEMQTRGISVRMVASLCNLEVSVIWGILEASQPIDADIAGHLAALGISEAFWLAMESQYRDGLAAGKKEI